MVNFYLSGNPVHDRVITAFYEGCPEEKQLRNVDSYKESEVAVIFGVYKSKVPQSYARGEVFRRQRQKKHDVVVLETGYINRGDGKNHHYAAGFNGLNGRADFRNQGMPGDRVLCDLYNHTSGDYILLCGQVPWDASVDHIDYPAWLDRMPSAIGMYSDLPIRFRPHPQYARVTVPGTKVSGNTLEEDLQGAAAVVTFNSNTGVDAMLEGVPVFAFDPGSMVYKIANTRLEQLKDPIVPDRKQWLSDLCYAQWTPAEMSEGLAWKHLFR